ncbi:hypothetical protein VKT23_007773 [Stygiomarasmius scandens]|uniref:Uncharacterized protein n=1 Tax=Marasmiellus scandens TaxID=2682957 RepID=A0ABR1JN03_9AGAR
MPARLTSAVIRSIHQEWASQNPASTDQKIDFGAWFHFIETGSARRNLSEDHRLVVAMSFLTPDLRDQLDRVVLEDVDVNMTDWEVFKATLIAMGEERVTLVRFDDEGDSIPNNFSTTMQCIIAGGLVGIGGAAILPSVGIAAVNAVGFTPSGVAAGSLAAEFQSIVYGGATRGLFSTLQSFGATAVMAPPTSLGLGAAAIIAGGTVFAVDRMREKQRGK